MSCGYKNVCTAERIMKWKYIWHMMTKEEALRRFKAAKQTKKDAVAALEEKMKQAYEERTGLKANYVVTL